MTTIPCPYCGKELSQVRLEPPGFPVTSSGPHLENDEKGNYKTCPHPDCSERVYFDRLPGPEGSPALLRVRPGQGRRAPRR